MRALCLCLLLSTLPAAAQAPALGQPPLPSLLLQGTDGSSYLFPEALRRARFTVLVFFSATCPCLAAHDQRLKALATSFGEGEVQILAVDPESGASLEQDRQEAARRGYPFPILLDPGGQLARALKVEFATTSAVLDAGGGLHFRGGIDSAKREPKDGAAFFLREALDALLKGQAPPRAEPKTLGCYLRLLG